MQDLHALISSAVNKAIESDPANRDYLRSLGNIRILLQSETPEFLIYLNMQDGLIKLEGFPKEDETPLEQAPSDLRIKATALSLVKLLISPAENAAALRDANVHVEGDVALLLELSQVIKKIDIDWEALLAERLGDSAAVLISRATKHAKTTTSSVFETQKESIEQWLQQPDAPVPNRVEYQQLKDKLRELNYRLDRLDAKLEQFSTNSTADT